MPEALWRYCITGWNGMPAGYIELGYVGDTLIEKRTYNIIRFTDARLDNSKQSYNSMAIFTRFSNDSVFRFVNNQDYLFFTLNVSIGDSYSTFRTAGSSTIWSDSACSSYMPLKIVDSNTVNYGGLNLQQYVLNDTLFPYLYVGSFNDSINYTLVERIGVINMYHFINTIEPPSSCEIPTDYYTVTLGRYSDDSFSHIFELCEGVGIKKSYDDQSITNIYPNPAKSYVKVSFPLHPTCSKEINVYNTNSTKVFSVTTVESTFTINTEEFTSGIYFLQCVIHENNTDKRSYQKFTII
jgi:hypothetical protein